MSDRKSMWCPLMREMCINGWTKSMGEDKKTHERPVCRFWTTITGKSPQEDKPVDKNDCAISWLPVVMLEQAKIESSTGAAVESLRNKVSDTNDSLIALHNNMLLPMGGMSIRRDAIDTNIESDHKKLIGPPEESKG